MKITVSIISLADHGTEVHVKAQGRGDSEAQWRGFQPWDFKVPDYINKHYKINQHLHIEVKPL
jgi:hypothetical protein